MGRTDGLTPEHPGLDAQVGVVGAGPVGLTLAGRLAQRGVSVLLLEQTPAHVGEGSKALCMQRETLEIWNRLGIGQRVADRGVQWHVGRTYYRTRELFSVELPGAGAEHFPPFVNISQTEVEELLLRRVAELPEVDLRWAHTLTGVSQHPSSVSVRCSTPDGERTFEVGYLVGTDGAHSGVRHALGMGFPGHSHEDLFLICDIRADLPYPNERRFYFDPPGNPGRQVLIHPQPDGAWRIDWQVPSGTDAEAERRNGGLDRRIRAVIGSRTPYELVWMTAYRFHQRVVERFGIGRVFLAGDAAHLMSPFGARGLNSGAADAENLAWKLALVLGGKAPAQLLASYDTERRAAALENVAVTDETMRFMVPHGTLRRLSSNVTLRGSVRSAFLRRRVNSGRLALPFCYAGSPIVDPGPADPALPRHGSAAPDAPLSVVGDPRGPARRLADLLGGDFVLLLVCAEEGQLAAGSGVRAARLSWPAPVQVVVVGPARRIAGATVVRDTDGALLATYGAAGPRAWLIRPDGHIAGSVALSQAEAVDQLPVMVARSIGAAASRRM
jgi:3-(3-hydroxy-phenyl)propionate hydroxylase